MRRKTNMTKSTKNTVSAPVVLKTLVGDIIKANPTSTLTEKKARVTLRLKMADVHAKNSSWVFNPSDYDRARSLFDPAYAAKVAASAKRAARPSKSKAPKVTTPKTEEVTA